MVFYLNQDKIFEIDPVQDLTDQKPIIGTSGSFTLWIGNGFWEIISSFVKSLVGF